MDNNVFEKNIRSHIEVAKKISADKQALDSTLKAVEKIISSIRSGGKMLICGNGGSAADANHLAAEFINRYLKERAPIAAISLCANTSNITSIGNDYSFDLVFSKQVEALGKKNDVLIAISNSGKSKNIIEDIKAEKEKGVYSILFTGSGKNECSKLADLSIHVPSDSTPRVQEMHLVLYHVICEMVESETFEK